MTIPQHTPARAGMTIPLGNTSALTLIAVGADTEGAYALLHYVAGPGAGAAFHTHQREDEAFYMLSGTLQVTRGDHTINASPGSYVHIPKGQWHAFRNATTEPMTALIILSPAGLEQFFVDLAALSATSPTGQPDAVAVAQLTEHYQLVFA
jgi:mannose-6-phosphate isomerase-like protein (cupin superfamily)